MKSEWLENKLKSNGLSSIFFEFEDIDFDSLGEGPRAAMRSAESWQEDLLIDDFSIPTLAVRQIHHRKENEPDALYFKYKTIEFGVEVWHQMDMMLVVLTPNDLTQEEFDKNGLKPEQRLNDVARKLLSNTDNMELVTDDYNKGVYFGSHKKIDGKEFQELSPIELLRWWYTKDKFGFAILKITPVIEGNIPSSAGVSDQQIHMWFDAIIAKRY